jgi:hypothetical protein
MKKRSFVVGIMAFSVLFVGIVSLLNKNLIFEEERIYTPRSKQEKLNADAKGSAEWLHALRENAVTGEIDHQAYTAAKNAVSNMRAQESIGALTWEELGPDNVGGRTRAFLIDRNNPNILYAGAVSGGLFKSTTRGSSWQKINDMQENLAIVSIAQAINGDIYYGTGEGMYYQNSGTGSGGILGGGLFKKKHNENHFEVLTSTVPTPSNSTGAQFASIGVVITDLTNPDRLWIGTNIGFLMSDNGGDTWQNTGVAGQCTDGVQDKNGGIWISAGNRGYYSPTGMPNTFDEITKAGSIGNTDLPRSSGRMVFAVSPQDKNYVYCVQTTGFGTTPSQFDKAFRSTDGGDNWQMIGQRTSTLNPHGTQGGYDHAVTVDAYNKNRILVGGVNFWEWSLQGGWQQVASGSRFSGQLYVHVDHHRFVYDTTSPGLVYAVNDGGIFRSNNNGVTWTEINKGYITTQFYGIGFSRDGVVMGGTQDNGTILIDGKGNTPKEGIRTIGIDFRGASRDGDGGFAEISAFTKDIMVKAMQYGIIGRSNNFGESFTEFYNFGRMDPTNRSPNLSSTFAPFVTPFLLWQDQFDDNSQDTIDFAAANATMGLGFGMGRNQFQGTLTRPQASARFVPGTFVIGAGADTLTADVNGNITGNGSGTFNNTTGEFNVTFNTPGGVIAQINMRCAVEYSAGDTVIVQSRTLSMPIRHELSQNLNPGEVEKIVDKVQSMYVVGLNSFVGPQNILAGGIWLTRKLHDFSTVTPDWIHVAHFGGTAGAPIATSALAFSRDGNYLYVGTSGGLLYRISGLAFNRDSLTADISSSQYNLDVEQIATFGRFVTSISVDQNNNDRVLVTLGGYGNSTSSIRYSTNATSATPAFESKMGNIPNMPVYASIINIHNSAEVVVGTDFGVFSTENINSVSPQWTPDNGEFANVPVFMLRQEINEFGSKPGKERYNGIVYAGTHGRGIWKTGDLSIQNPLTTNREPDMVKEKESLVIYPNPAQYQTNVRVQLENYSDVQMMVRDMSGRVVRNATFKSVAPGETDLELSLEGLRSGTYVIQTGAAGFEKIGKLIKVN